MHECHKIISCEMNENSFCQCSNKDERDILNISIANIQKCNFCNDLSRSVVASVRVGHSERPVRGEIQSTGAWAAEFLQAMGDLSFWVKFSQLDIRQRQ